MTTIQEKLKNAPRVNKPDLFFKTTPGHYAEHDQFLGIPVPTLRAIAKEHTTLSHQDLHTLLTSPYNEERLLALLILVHQYKKSPLPTYHFYLDHLSYINNWNLVDSSAHLILGPHLEAHTDLAHSQNLWHRRIAIIATLYHIKKGNLDHTFHIAQALLNDTHDLIHKATGWMLREAGKQNLSALTAFLDAHHTRMPRTMLRYAIEKYPPETRAHYLKK